VGAVSSTSAQFITQPSWKNSSNEEALTPMSTQTTGLTDGTPTTSDGDPIYEELLATATPTPTGDDDGLSGGEIGGIAAGCAVFAIGAVALTYCCCSKKQKVAPDQTSATPDPPVSSSP
jgi:hypothetical protein